ncbi:hypothetical protein EV426DRAFT_447695 [Tirmania nivea]|nr:hypothetical protein EV426DRAFT_447695 [Tirmania nivea]
MCKSYEAHTGTVDGADSVQVARFTLQARFLAANSLSEMTRTLKQTTYQRLISLCKAMQSVLILISISVWIGDAPQSVLVGTTPSKSQPVLSASLFCCPLVRYRGRSYPHPPDGIPPPGLRSESLHTRSNVFTPLANQQFFMGAKWFITLYSYERPLRRRRLNRRPQPHRKGRTAPDPKQSSATDRRRHCSAVRFEADCRLVSHSKSTRCGVLGARCRPGVSERASAASASHLDIYCHVGMEGMESSVGRNISSRRLTVRGHKII